MTKNLEIKSLKNLITTINIGNININSPSHIIGKLKTVNHPILLYNQDFFNNISFIEIKNNFCIFCIINSIIPKTIKFYIKFNTEKYDLATILKKDLGMLETNDPLNIWNYFEKINKEIINDIDLNLNFYHRNTYTNIISNITNNSAIIKVYDLSFQNVKYEFNQDILLTFKAKNWPIKIPVRVLNLIEIPNNDEKTIINEFLNLNNLEYNDYKLLVKKVIIHDDCAKIVIFSHFLNFCNFYIKFKLKKVFTR